MRQLTLVLFLIPVFPLAAQDRAAVNGTVTDSFEALVENAKIELIAPATGLCREAMTNESGFQTTHNWFNPAAFTLQANGTRENLGRSSARSPTLLTLAPWELAPPGA